MPAKTKRIGVLKSYKMVVLTVGETNENRFEYQCGGHRWGVWPR